MISRATLLAALLACVSVSAQSDWEFYLPEMETEVKETQRWFNEVQARQDGGGWLAGTEDEDGNMDHPWDTNIGKKIFAGGLMIALHERLKSYKAGLDISASDQVMEQVLNAYYQTAVTLQEKISEYENVVSETTWDLWRGRGRAIEAAYQSLLDDPRLDEDNNTHHAVRLDAVSDAIVDYQLELAEGGDPDRMEEHWTEFWLKAQDLAEYLVGGE